MRNNQIDYQQLSMPKKYVYISKINICKHVILNAIRNHRKIKNITHNNLVSGSTYILTFPLNNINNHSFTILNYYLLSSLKEQV